ncbi:MAG TPA: hypothetical protein VEW67_08275 [Thermoleophilaceae bacterium]|nr:hypothetical protein [Thermoleophilaceae bacterium]
MAVVHTQATLAQALDLAAATPDNWPTMEGDSGGIGRRRAALLVGVLVSLTCALVPPIAGGATWTKLDRGNELRFKLKGSELTLTIVERRNFIRIPTTRSELFGKRLWVGCGTSFRAVNRDTVVGALVRWPRGAESISVPLDRDISRRAKWCLVESRGEFAGGDLAFVSFRKAEPGRRLTSGRLLDGTPWSLVAWRGNKLQPCVQLRLEGLRLGDLNSTSCFDDEAETEAGIEATFDVPTCRGGTVVLGAAARSAARVDIHVVGGQVVPATLWPRPRGSRVRAQYFTALLDGPSQGEPADIEAVAAYDARGALIARDRGINGSGGGDCGRPRPASSSDRR